MIEDRIKTLTFAAVAALALGAELDGGKFCGITTLKDGTHAAVVLLLDKPANELNWKDAGAWAAEVNGTLPTRPVSALLYANAKDQFKPEWYWTCEETEFSASYAWICGFYGGGQTSVHKSRTYSAVAVRMIPLVL